MKSLELLDLLAHVRALVESSNLTSLLEPVRKQTEQKGFMETTDLHLTCHRFCVLICVKLTIRSLHWEPGPSDKALLGHPHSPVYRMLLCDCLAASRKCLVCCSACSVLSSLLRIWGGKTVKLLGAYYLVRIAK